MLNLSAAQNETSCRPLPCDWLSQPRTTTAAPPLAHLIGETGTGVNRFGCVTTILRRASLVPLLTLKHPRLGGRRMSTQQRSAAPSEHRRITGCPGESHFRFRSADCTPFERAQSRSKSFPIPGLHPRTTSVLVEMRVKFPEGVRQFLSVSMRGLYLAGRPRLRGFACVPHSRESSFADGLTRFRQLTP